MKFIRFMFTAFLVSLALFSCKKEDKQNEFPGATTTGANTFGCYVDNIQFIPCKTTGGISPLKRLQASSFLSDPNHFNGGITAINDCNKTNTYYSIFIHFNTAQITANTTYKLGSFYDSSKNVVSCMYSQDLANYDSDSTLNGTLTVTYYDYYKRILSGNFQATLKDEQDSQTVNLTGGVFDVTF